MGLVKTLLQTVHLISGNVVAFTEPKVCLMQQFLADIIIFQLNKHTDGYKPLRPAFTRNKPHLEHSCSHFMDIMKITIKLHRYPMLDESHITTLLPILRFPWRIHTSICQILVKLVSTEVKYLDSRSISIFLCSTVINVLFWNITSVGSRKGQ